MDSPISYEELSSALVKLKLKKSPGPDCITNEMIINLGKPHYTSCLKYIINHGKKNHYHNTGEKQQCSQYTSQEKPSQKPLVTDPLAGLAKFDWKVVAQWATKYNNLVAQQ